MQASRGRSHSHPPLPITLLMWQALPTPKSGPVRAQVAQAAKYPSLQQSFNMWQGLPTLIMSDK